MKKFLVVPRRKVPTNSIRILFNKFFCELGLVVKKSRISSEAITVKVKPKNSTMKVYLFGSPGTITMRLKYPVKQNSLIILVNIILLKFCPPCMMVRLRVNLQILAKRVLNPPAPSI